MTLASVTHEGITVEAHNTSADDMRTALGIASSPTTESSSAEGVAAAPSTPADASQAAADADAGSEAESDAQAVDPSSDAGRALTKKRGSLQARIDELTREKHATKREADTVKAEVAQLRAELAALKQPKSQDQPASAPADDGKPRLKQFTDQIGTKYESYEDAVEAHTDALTDWKDARRHQASVDEQASRAQRERFTAHNERVETFKQRTPDFDAVVTDQIRVSRPMVDAMVASEHGPAMQYYLGQHPAEAARIAQLSIGLQFYEMGKIEALVSAAPSGPASPTQQKTTAKPPIKPVVSSPVQHVDDGPPGDDADDETHRQYMNRKELESRRRR